MSKLYRAGVRGQGGQRIRWLTAGNDPSTNRRVSQGRVIIDGGPAPFSVWGYNLKATIQCVDCGTWIRNGQIHSAHGTDLMQIISKEVVDEDWGRPMFGVSPGDVVPESRRGRVCSADEVIASDYLNTSE